MGLSKSVVDAFQLGSLDIQPPADTSIDGVTLGVSEGAASEEGGDSAKGADVFDLAGHIEADKL